MSSTHPIGVVTGITGAQGRSIAHRLIKAGYQVRGLTRSSAQNDHIQSMGATPVIVDFSDLTRLVYAFDHADVVAFTSPIDHRAGVRERLADQIAKAAEQARVRRIVFNSAAEIVDDYDRPVAQVLKAIRDRLQASSVPVMTLHQQFIWII